MLKVMLKVMHESCQLQETYMRHYINAYRPGRLRSAACHASPSGMAAAPVAGTLPPLAQAGCTREIPVDAAHLTCALRRRKNEALVPV